MTPSKTGEGASNTTFNEATRVDLPLNLKSRADAPWRNIFGKADAGTDTSPDGEALFGGYQAEFLDEGWAEPRR